MRVLPCGPVAALLEFPDRAAREAWVRGAESVRELREAAELIPAEQTVLIAAPAADALASLVEAARAVTPVEAPPPTARTVELPVVYDGDDLTDAADALGLSVEALVRWHGEATWGVSFCGFAPGFAYLTRPGHEVSVPRRAHPRTRVPSGAVGLAGPYTGVYPRPSPGGWQLLGRTDAVLWDAAADDPALLRPGTQVRFVDVTGDSR